MGTGTGSRFGPGGQGLGLYYYPNAFQRVGYTEDRLNTGGVAHRARIYPAKDRAGRAMANSYIVAFEDASNGDYQDYVFLVTGAKPANQQADPGAIRINFSDQAAALPAGYLRDYGQGFASRTGADQGSGLEYGWKNQATETALDITANGRFRSVAAQTDQRLKTFMHMQSADVPNFSGVPAYAFWEIGLEDGLYAVTVAAGDTLFQSAPGAHTINLEGRTVIDRFTPTGSSGAATRTTTATAQVAVTDGYLTVDAIGGTNTKIDYIDIVPAGAVPGDDPTEGAQVKVNFQPATAPTPAGWSRDTGLPYSAQAGSGWLVNGTPTDRTGATRYRQTPTQGINYPAGDPLLQTYIHMGPAPGFSSGTWEYDLPNGTYTVAVSAGVPAYLDSTHGIAAEGQPLIASFVPTGATPFQTGYRDVNVTDGKLTLSSTGTNTKINWVSIKGSGLDQVPDSTPAAKYNFQPAEAATPAGWTADSGGAFDADGYGWLVGGLPADRLGAANRTRAMNGITYPAGNPLLQTLMHMQAGPTAGVVDGVWERALANGTYEVSLSVGDANYLDSTHSIAVEGQELFEPFVPTTTAPFKTGTATVEVADGRLTLAPTGTNTKINWVTIKGANLNDPVITVDVNGVRVDSGYSGGSATVSLAAKAAGSASIEALTYAVDDGTPADYSEPFTLDGTGTHTVQVRAEDSQGRSSTRTVTVEVQNVSGTLQLRSGQASRGADGAPVPGFAEDWLVVHRINSDPAAHPVVDQAGLTLSNSGTGDLRVSDLPLRGTNAADFTLVDPPQLPLVLAPGETATVTVKFTAASGTRGVR
ncbi:hypothetical protein HER39_07860, partial [Arthrobacter deserti]|nr:hypothetical protein [Arthrobacter deserti]